MKESRQVKRARERAEAKAAGRPRIELVIEIDLCRHLVDDFEADESDNAEADYWSAEWGLQGSSQTASRVC